jgi:hypothetical protein
MRISHIPVAHVAVLLLSDTCRQLGSRQATAFWSQHVNPQNHEKCIFITDVRSKVLSAWVYEPAGWRDTGLFLRRCSDEVQSMEAMTCLIHTYMNNVQNQVLWPSVHHNAIRWKEIVKKRRYLLSIEMLIKRDSFNYMCYMKRWLWIVYLREKVVVDYFKTMEWCMHEREDDGLQLVWITVVRTRDLSVTEQGHCAILCYFMNQVTSILQIIFMVEPCILRSIDCLLLTNALNVNFI